MLILRTTAPVAKGTTAPVAIALSITTAQWKTKEIRMIMRPENMRPERVSIMAGRGMPFQPSGGRLLYHGVPVLLPLRVHPILLVPEIGFLLLARRALGELSSRKA